MTIRIAENKDAPRIHELLIQIVNHHHDLYPERFPKDTPKYSVTEVQGLIQNPQMTVWVYEHNEHVEGYLIGWMDGDVFFVDDICVNEAARGLKIGHQLMTHLETQTETAPFTEVRLNVWTKNTAAINFYEKEGYEPLKYVLTKKIER